MKGIKLKILNNKKLKNNYDYKLNYIFLIYY